MIAALYGFSALATVLAWTLARRSAEHRPVAWLLTTGLAVDLARRALRTFYILPVIRPLRGHPLTGVPLAVAHVNDALFLTWSAALAACAMVVYLGRRLWAAVAVWAAVVAGLVAFHPTESSGTLGRVFTAAQLGSLAAGLGCAATWYLSESRAPTTTAQASLGVIIAGELATLVGSWRIGAFDNWHISQILYLLLYMLLGVLQGGFLWQSRSR
jgi:hypothetical protein